jgi:UDP-N-acetylmuramate--alanine ligase
MHDVETTFLEFMDRVPFYGMVVACNDDPALRALLPRAARRVMTYGTREDSDFRVSPLGVSTPGQAAPAHDLPLSRFQVTYRGQDLGEFALHVPGQHNVLNATAALAVGIGLDIPPAKIREALASFRGVDRRFQKKGEAAGVTVIDDYGHHPTEIGATLAAARQCGYKKIHVIFQPHRYTRTQLLMDEFATAFADASSVYVLDIYPASEPPIPGVTGEALAHRINEKGNRTATYVASFTAAATAAAATAQPGDMILTLGAGNVVQLGPLVLEKLQARMPVPTK